jgi:all-trans-retinol dehydrogenase (NAD+)
VSDYAAVMEMKRQIDIDLGTVDILLNNAGLLPKVSLMEGDASDISKIIDVNLKAQFWASLCQQNMIDHKIQLRCFSLLQTIRAFLGDMMKRRKGHICAISSLCGKRV